MGKYKMRWNIIIGLLLLVGSLLLLNHQFGEQLHGSKNNYSFIDIRVLKTKEDADCILISSGNSGIMIDTGEAVDGRMILEELDQIGIETLDYLILTHPDKDHIGGAMEILQGIKVSKVIEPYYGDENQQLDAINEYCKENRIPVYYPNRTWRIDLQHLKLVIYPSLERHYKDSNNYSLAVLATHGDSKMFFAADAKKKRLEELMKLNLPEVNFYKVPHHGRANAATSKMFHMLQPTYAVVTSKTADQEVVDSCQLWGTELLYAGEETIHFQSDGKRFFPFHE